MSAKAGKRPLRSLTAHEKLDAIRRVHDGESKASVARDIGVPESTLRGWCKNEDKISYLSRQSSPETDSDSLMFDQGPKEKKAKLSLGDDTAAVSLAASAPTASSLANNNNTGVVTPFNLSLKQPSAPPVAATAECGTNKMSVSEREKNRAELARLSVELGLNRPEMFAQAGGNGASSSVTDLSANLSLLAHQWNNLLLQQQMSKLSKSVVAAAAAAAPKPAPPAAAAAPFTDTAALTNSLATQILNYTKMQQQQQQQQQHQMHEHAVKKLPKVDPQKSVEDSVWYWLRSQQAMLGMNGGAGSLNQLPMASSASTSALTATMPTATTMAPSSSLLTTTSHSSMTTNTATAAGGSLSMPAVPTGVDGSWFWKWYKQYTSQLQSAMTANVAATTCTTNTAPAIITTTTSPLLSANSSTSMPSSKPLLYQQLSREPVLECAENLSKTSNNDAASSLVAPQPPTTVNVDDSTDVADNHIDEAPPVVAADNDESVNIATSDSSADNAIDATVAPVSPKSPINASSTAATGTNLTTITAAAKSRSVLDNLLLHNNNNNVSESDVAGSGDRGGKDGKEDLVSIGEALEHGEKFLRWLEACSEPSVTAMQIMQFRGLINNIKNGADRRTGENRMKVRRK